MRVTLIWAQSSAGVIGRGGDLPWRVPEDLARFRELTTGHPVIMGRRTWESLPAAARPLRDRPTIVVTRRTDYDAPGAQVVGSLPEALERARGHGTGQVWIAGGAEIYRQAVPYATDAEVTEVDTEVDGDTYAPPLTGWRKLSAGEWRESRTGLAYRHLRYCPGPPA